MTAADNLFSGLYIHIPFCVRKCLYCDFVSVRSGVDQYGLYVDAVLQEIRYWRKKFEGNPVSTVYLGGGTPTLIGADLLGRLLDAVRSSFVLVPDAEISVEVNPGTVSNDFWRLIQDAGVTRVSIGVQSFSDRLLAVLGRVHDAATAGRTVKAAFDAGMDNVGIDLIYGIPGQASGDWEKTLDRALELSPRHLSAYCLSYEEGTPLALMKENGKVAPAVAEKEAEMYYRALCRLETAGYRRYEISAFSLPGYECRHNLNYWNYGEYLGIGAGAHSFHGGRRWENTGDVGRYMAERYQGPFMEHPSIDASGRMKEFIMLGLRKAEGIAIADIEREWGSGPASSVKNTAMRLAESGFVDIAGGRVRIADHGLFISNELITEFF